MASVTWNGLDDLTRELDALPADLGDAGAALALATGRQAAAAIAAAYPHRSGTLARDLTVHEKRTTYGAVSTVQNTAPYALAFEYGRQTGRHGTTPARPTFIPIRDTYQAGLHQAIAALLISRGLTVRGNGDE
jgi:hypothetical protein